MPTLNRKKARLAKRSRAVSSIIRNIGRHEWNILSKARKNALVLEQLAIYNKGVKEKRREIKQICKDYKSIYSNVQFAWKKKDEKKRITLYCNSFFVIKFY